MDSFTSSLSSHLDHRGHATYLADSEWSTRSTEDQYGLLDQYLSNYGLRLTPDGEGIMGNTEQDDVELMMDYEADSGMNMEPLCLTKTPAEETYQQQQEMTGAKLKGGKVKMYEMGPAEDKEQEKKRMNAINARKNREQKKRQVSRLEQEVNNLRHVNSQCRKALIRSYAEVQKLTQTKSDLEETLRVRDRQLRGKDVEIRNRREKMALMLSHLDLIASSLDESNAAKKYISSLLERMSSECKS